MNRPTIPFLDLVTCHRELEGELIDVVRQALSTAAFIGGPVVEEFEREFAAFCGTRHSVGAASGTDALRFALTAVGVKPGDTVVTVPNTFIATTEAISQAGARVDFVDVDERIYTLDPVALRNYLESECSRDPQTGHAVHNRTGSRVAAVVPVHLYGQMADMDAIVDLAARYGLKVVEDACQAHGAEYYSRTQGRWRRAGSIGHAAAFSFYPGKNLGACGEAGAITTNDEQAASICRMLRDHGQSKKYYHDLEGYNGRLDAIQAGFLRVKLRHLAQWNEARRERAREYDVLLRDHDELVVTPHVPEWSRPVYHLYVVQVADRDGFQARMSQAGIGTGIHYPIPLHLQKAYSDRQFGSGSFPVSERLAPRILSLPMFPNLTSEDQRKVAAEVLQLAATTV